MGQTSSAISSSSSSTSFTSSLSSVSSSTTSFASSTSSISSSTSSLSSSVLPSPSAASDTLTCTGKDTGFTLTHTTSKETYDIICGADYRNGDFKFLWTDSFGSCIAACDEETSCVTVAFRSGACYLKNRSTGQSSDSNVWSAKKQSTATAPSNDGPTCEDNASDATTYQSSNEKQFKIACGKDYWGGDLTSTSTSSFKECIETCTTNAECVDVSYVNGACYLKRPKSSLTEAGNVWTAELIDTSATSPTSPTTSAQEVTCANSKDDQKPYIAKNGGTYLVECGVDYFGGDLQAVDSATFAACMDTCDNTDSCLDVSYVYGRCYMKNSLTTSSPARDVWTGRKISSGLTGTSTSVATTTATVAPTTFVSTVRSVVTPIVSTTSTTQAVKPTGMNLDFENGDLSNWVIQNSDSTWSNTVVSPGHSRDGVTSNFALQFSRTPSVGKIFTNSQMKQTIPDLVGGQTYRIEFSWKYSTDIVSSHECRVLVFLWDSFLASLAPYTTPNSQTDEHAVFPADKCGTSTRQSTTVLAPQQPGEWQRYTVYYRARSDSRNPPDLFLIHECYPGTQNPTQEIYFDDIVIAPEAAC